MPELRFEWDETKAKSNIKKHSVAFQEATTVFYDEDARIMGDPDHSEEEDRFIIMGLSHSPRLLVVVHCYRESDSVIRLISARKATKTEAKQYLKNKT